MYIPRKKQFNSIGDTEGHIVTTAQRDPFKWIAAQIRACKKEKAFCTHVKIGRIDRQKKIGKKDRQNRSAKKIGKKDEPSSWDRQNRSVKVDIYDGVEFDYENIQVIGLTTTPWLALNLKFTSNFHLPTSNRIKKRPSCKLNYMNNFRYEVTSFFSVLTEWDPMTLSTFIGRSRTAHRFQLF